MKTETTWIRTLLPSHYICEPRDNGVHCHSSHGITDGMHWACIMNKLKEHFDKRFMEVFHQVNTDHESFTVYIRD